MVKGLKALNGPVLFFLRTFLQNRKSKRLGKKNLKIEIVMQKQCSVSTCPISFLEPRHKLRYQSKKKS